jgi:hypothetical protein
MHSDGSDITIASTATRAGVHRSFIHRHGDLHAAVLAAAAETIENPSPASMTISHRSVLTENANLHALNRRLAERIRDLEDRLSEMLGQHAFERSGLGAPTATAALQDELEHHQQLVLDLTSRIEELDENWPRPAKPTAGSWPNSTASEHLSNAVMHWHDLPEAWGTRPTSAHQERDRPGACLPGG